MATRSKRTPRAPARAKAAIPKKGPVTLAEARALAQAKQPKRAARKLAAPAASPAAVGAEREKLDQERRDQIARRIREYKAAMVIMKKRGARRPRPKAVAKQGEPVAKAKSFEPLQILAEGDSWFDYPVPLFGGGIIPRLEDRLGVPILNLAKAGDGPVAQADLRPPQISNSRGGNGGRQGNAEAVRGVVDVFSCAAESDVYQRPGHAGAAD